MHPYRDGERREEESAPSSDRAIAIAILLASSMLLAIGFASDRPTEAGLGTAALLFGVYALRARS